MTLLARRLLQAIPVLFGALALTFVIVRVLPGSVAITILGESATPEAVADLESRLGLSQPLIQQFGTYLRNLALGDLGDSLRTAEPVLPMVLERFWISVQLMLFAQLFALGLAIALAAWSAQRLGGPIERLSGLLASSAISIPSFLLGIVLILLFAVHWRVFPAIGFSAISEGLGAYVRHLALPVITLGFAEFAIYFRLLQSEIHRAAREEYVTTALAKGLSRAAIVRRHILRNSLFPLVTVVGLNIGRLLGGSVIVESVFAIPGMGRLLIEAIAARDMTVVQGIVVFIAVGYILVAVLVDLLYSVLDPRLRHESRA